jgi:hypothetical protein
MKPFSGACSQLRIHKLKQLGCAIESRSGLDRRGHGGLEEAGFAVTEYLQELTCSLIARVESEPLQSLS